MTAVMTAVMNVAMYVAMYVAMTAVMTAAARPGGPIDRRVAHGGDLTVGPPAGR